MAHGVDLHNAISLHPLPLLHIDRSNDSPSPAGHSMAEQSRRKAKGGTSTSVEHEKSATDNISRRAGPATGEDIESQRRNSYDISSDPYCLSAGLKSANEIDDIRTSISSRRNSAFGGLDKDTFKARKVKTFYEEQNENIERLLKPVDEHRRLKKEENEGNAMQYKIAVNGSFAANLVLAGLQLYAAIASGSLSLFTTMADALFDPLSNITLILCNRAVNRVDSRKYPSGKARIETAGNIVFCFLMCAVSFILIVLSARDLASGSDTVTAGFHLPSVIAVGIAFVTKLTLFVYCYSLRNQYSQIKILWEDHRNDLMINGVGLLTSIGGSKLRWWIDPMGAIILSFLIAFLWLRTAYSEFQLLIGVSADTNTLQLLTYVCESHRRTLVTNCTNILQP